MSDCRRTFSASIRTLVDMPTAYVLAPIDAVAAAELRSLDGERYVADAKPGYPCRQCLRDAEIGETLILVSHDPFSVDSPYRSRSPIFLHEQRCAPSNGVDGLPDQLTCRQLSVRSFDEQALMIDAAVIDGTTLDDQLQRFFANDDTSEVHVHNASRGCWATSVTRSL